MATLAEKLADIDALYGRAAALRASRFDPRQYSRPAGPTLCRCQNVDHADGICSDRCSAVITDGRPLCPDCAAYGAHGLYQCSDCQRVFDHPLPLRWYCGCRGWE